MKRAAAIVLLLLVAATTALGQSAKSTLEDPVLATRFNTISDKLVCQCSCQMILRVCNHVNCPSAIPMRQSVEKQLLEGKSDEEIIQGFVDEMGLKVLSSPPTEGFNIAAWVMPGFGLLVGLFVVFYMASRWAARRRLATAGGTSVEIDPDLQKRIEKEMRIDQ
ncbi:MAG: cytochrome c-type biogenesis protein CcmH [Candidatus Krumholzibacteria bacterium]|nr:cytochrome c-type biogenesis protein CcmH [Candidatus Krumholzibacteria bacterium]MDH4338649.1 cytochrome c-type biogenesis protein CcmH [Candidatus Krumholzibacteria bacterium]MDH5270721.1 cytochrome c-type biogenesis protein CcmH [Candidatus Krumholzibacteria bacterium]